MDTLPAFFASSDDHLDATLACELETDKHCDTEAADHHSPPFVCLYGATATFSGSDGGRPGCTSMLACIRPTTGLSSGGKAGAEYAHDDQLAKTGMTNVPRCFNPMFSPAMMMSGAGGAAAAELSIVSVDIILPSDPVATGGKAQAAAAAVVAAAASVEAPPEAGTAAAAAARLDEPTEKTTGLPETGVAGSTAEAEAAAAAAGGPQGMLQHDHDYLLELLKSSSEEEDEAELHSAAALASALAQRRATAEAEAAATAASLSEEQRQQQQAWQQQKQELLELARRRKRVKQALIEANTAMLQAMAVTARGEWWERHARRPSEVVQPGDSGDVTQLLGASDGGDEAAAMVAAAAAAAGDAAPELRDPLDPDAEYVNWATDVDLGWYCI